MAASSNNNLTASTLSQGKPLRQSNMELLRIVAMMMVLGVHANFLALGSPIKDIASMNSVWRVFFESLCIGCVNLFVMLSGWFTITPKWRSVFSLLFQVLFFILVAQLFRSCYIEDIPFSPYETVMELLNGYWYVSAYLGVYLLSPVLNKFLQNSNLKEIGYILISFYIFQTLFGWIVNNDFIAKGYSTFSFIGLYVLAYWLRRIKDKIAINGLVLFIFSVIVNSIYYYLPVGDTCLRMCSYTNPLNIIGCCGLLIWFSNLNIKLNRVINWLSASSFAVYLIHINPLLGRFYLDYCKYMYSSFSGCEYLALLFISLVGVFMGGVIIDQIRLFIWSKCVLPLYQRGVGILDLNKGREYTIS